VGEGGLDIPPFFILAVRFTLATALVIAWRPRTLRFRGLRSEWLIALWLGVLLGGSYITQIIGIVTIGATRSHFITNLSVVFVPILQMFYLRRPLSRGAGIGVVSAFMGLCLLTNPLAGGVKIGDLWTLGCALITSLYMIELQRLAARVTLPRMLLGQFGLIALFCWAAAPLGTSAPDAIGLRVWTLLIYLGTLCTFGTVLLHNRFQPETTPTRAALIFASGPVMTFFIAGATLGETLSPWQLLGAGLILAGIVVTEVL
jgi:drug/metabolite transporter (DMT)-like permease